MVTEGSVKTGSPWVSRQTLLREVCVIVSQLFLAALGFGFHKHQSFWAITLTSLERWSEGIWNWMEVNIRGVQGAGFLGDCMCCQWWCYWSGWWQNVGGKIANPAVGTVVFDEGQCMESVRWQWGDWGGDGNRQYLAWVLVVVKIMYIFFKTQTVHLKWVHFSWAPKSL